MVVKVRRFPTFTPWANDLTDINRTVENFFGDLLDTTPVTRYSHYPRFDLAEYENESVLIAEMPGIQKENVKISIDNGYITIGGERKPYEMSEGSKWIRNEISAGTFNRTIELPHEIDTNNISAELKDGILRVTLPKAEKIKPREISIK